jgi:hypothetical protein
MFRPINIFFSKRWLALRLSGKKRNGNEVQNEKRRINWEIHVIDAAAFFPFYFLNTKNTEKNSDLDSCFVRF